MSIFMLTETLRPGAVYASLIDDVSAMPRTSDQFQYFRSNRFETPRYATTCLLKRYPPRRSTTNDDGGAKHVAEAQLFGAMSLDFFAAWNSRSVCANQRSLGS